MRKLFAALTAGALVVFLLVGFAGGHHQTVRVDTRPMSIDTPDWFSTPGAVSQVIGIPNPAVGTDIRYTTINGGRFVAVQFNLSTDATAVTRKVNLQIQDSSGNIVYTMQLNLAIAASTSTGITYGTGLPFFSQSGLGYNANLAMAPTPASLFIGVGWTIATFTGGLAPGDQYQGADLILTSS